MLSKFPKQIKYIVGNEAAERYGYYGMRSILVIFMVETLLMAKTEATAVYHIFAGACYLLPLLGAFLSDRYWGKYHTIMRLSIVYCIGYFVLALVQNQTGLYIGLALIALGSGGIKPCVSANVGDQFTQDQKEEMRQVFNIFYFVINFGSFFSSIITPWTLPKFGPMVAFGIPGTLMVIATIVFWMGRKYYVMVPPTPRDPHGPLAILVSALKNYKTGQQNFLDGALKDHSAEQIDGLRAVGGIASIFVTVSVFWALFDQHGSTWVLQAKEMNLNFMGLELLPSQIPAMNPIMVMVLIPIMMKLVYPGIEKLGIAVTPLRKMTAGMLLAGFSFLQVAVIQYVLDQGVQLNVAWQFFPFLTITISEVLISITGLEFAYTQAPRTMKSTIMSLWLLTVFFGNMITAYIAQVNTFQGGDFFMFFAVMMIVVGLVFAFIAANYKERSFMEN